MAPVQQACGRVEAHFDVTQERPPLLFKVLRRKLEFSRIAIFFPAFTWTSDGSAAQVQSATLLADLQRVRNEVGRQPHVVLQNGHQRRGAEKSAGVDGVWENVT